MLFLSVRKHETPVILSLSKKRKPATPETKWRVGCPKTLQKTNRLVSTAPSSVQPTPKKGEGRRCRAASSIRPPPCGARRAGPAGLTRQPYFSRKAVAGSALSPSSPRITAYHRTSLHLGASCPQDSAFSQFSRMFPHFLRTSKFSLHLLVPG